ncbi:MAG: hypothetical protein ACFFBP_10650 [Promethearchaeota archaeon]
MTYDAYFPGVLTIFIYYIILIILSILISILMFKKYFERKTKATFYMSLVYTMGTIALFIISIGLYEVILTGYFKEIYRLSLPLGFTFLNIASMIILIIAGDVTESQIYKKVKIPIIILGVLIIVLLFLPTNWWGTPQVDYEGKLSTRLIVTAFLALYNVLIYIFMARIYYLASHRTIDPVARFGFRLLDYSMICMVIFLLLYTIDTILIALGDKGYSIFIYIAWFFVISFYVLSYLSLVMPHWVEKRIKK